MNRPVDFASYDQDFFAWTQRQASVLRILPADTLGDSVDIAHVAEEIEDLGKRELREVKSLLSRLLEHLIKIASGRSIATDAHWRVEALVFQRDAFNGFSPAMRRHLDVADLWHQGRKFAAAALDIDLSSLGIPSECPFALETLVSDDFDLDRCLAAMPMKAM